MLINSEEEAIEFLWSQTPEPSVMYVPLSFVRANHKANGREDISAFLVQTVDMPGDAITVISETSISILTDDNGCLSRQKS